MASPSIVCDSLSKSISPSASESRADDSGRHTMEDEDSVELEMDDDFDVASSPVTPGFGERRHNSRFSINGMDTHNEQHHSITKDVPMSRKNGKHHLELDAHHFKEARKSPPPSLDVDWMLEPDSRASHSQASLPYASRIGHFDIPEAHMQSLNRTALNLHLPYSTPEKKDIDQNTVDHASAIHFSVHHKHVDSSRTCDSCQQPTVTGSELSTCGNCKWAMYCSRECQLADWPTHKHRCKLRNPYHFVKHRLKDDDPRSINWYFKLLDTLERTGIGPDKDRLNQQLNTNTARNYAKKLFKKFIHYTSLGHPVLVDCFKLRCCDERRLLRSPTEREYRVPKFARFVYAAKGIGLLPNTFNKYDYAELKSQAVQKHKIRDRVDSDAVMTELQSYYPDVITPELPVIEDDGKQGAAGNKQTPSKNTLTINRLYSGEPVSGRERRRRSSRSPNAPAPPPEPVIPCRPRITIVQLRALQLAVCGPLCIGHNEYLWPERLIKLTGNSTTEPPEPPNDASGSVSQVRFRTKTTHSKVL